MHITIQHYSTIEHPTLLKEINAQMLKIDLIYHRLTVKMCQKNISPTRTQALLAVNSSLMILSELQSLRVSLQVFLCNVNQKQPSCKRQEVTPKQGKKETNSDTRGKAESGAASGAGEFNY